MKPGLRTATEAQEWYPGYRERYKQDWHRVYQGRAVFRAEFRPGYWARGDDGIDAWITHTPDWDREWFKAHKMLLPRFGDAASTYWRDYGDGLRGLSYRLSAGVVGNQP